MVMRRTVSGAEMRRERVEGFLARNNRDDLDFDKVGPAGRPLGEKSGVVALHHEEAAAEAGVDPAVQNGQTIRAQPSLVVEPFVSGAGIAVLEMLDHEKLHAPSPHQADRDLELNGSVEVDKPYDRHGNGPQADFARLSLDLRRQIVEWGMLDVLAHLPTLCSDAERFGPSNREPNQ